MNKMVVMPNKLRDKRDAKPAQTFVLFFDQFQNYLSEKLLNESVPEKRNCYNSTIN